MSYVEGEPGSGCSLLFSRVIACFWFYMYELIAGLWLMGLFTWLLRSSFQWV
ncbi:MAG: hypothetical protein L7G99_06985 [Vulcanisaeta sp.]|nr:hypothetical protein [Vulcanisaeta sp.]